jgi:hypothetical protein
MKNELIILLSKKIFTKSRERRTNFSLLFHGIRISEKSTKLDVFAACSRMCNG